MGLGTTFTKHSLRQQTARSSEDRDGIFEVKKERIIEWIMNSFIHHAKRLGFS